MKIPQNPRPLNGPRLVSLAALSLGVLSASSIAATVTWTGNTSTAWNTGANWSPASVPVNGDTLVFGRPGASGVALSDDITSLTVGGADTDGLVIGSSAGSYTIARAGSQTITLGSSGTGIGIKNTSLFLQTLSVPVVMSGNQTIQVGDTTGASLSALTFSGSGVAITGGGRLTKTGNGLLTMGGNSVISGLTISGGTVNISSDGNLSSPAPASATAGWLVLNGGTLRTNLNAAFTINANRGIALGDGTVGSGGTINTTVTNAGLANSSSLTYNGVIANNGGTNSLTKTGNQILSLGGMNTYTGATIVNQGELLLNYAAGTATGDNIINSASNLVLGGVSTALSNTVAGNPILFVQGNATTARSQTFASTTLNQGTSSIAARGDGAVNATLALGAITHNAGGVVGFSLLTNGTAGTGVITTTTANTNGILGGWATTAGAAANSATPLTQTDWAANDGSGNIVAYTGYTVATTTTGTPVSLASNAANNVRITSASTGNLTLTFAANLSELNTIQSTDTVDRTIATGSGNKLRLGQYGGVWTASTGKLTIGGSGSAAGGLTAGGADDTAGEIVFNTGANITVNALISNNGTGVVSLTKTGSATLVLNSANTFSGGVFVNQGTVSVSNGSGLGTGSVTVLPAAVVNLTTTGATYTNNFNLSGSALTPGANTLSGTITLIGDTVIGSSGSAGANFTGKITGDYNLSFLGSTTTLSNTGNDYSGNLGINGTTGLLASGAVTVKLGNNEVISNGAGKGNVYLAGSGTAGNFSTLDLNGKTETINGLSSSGTAAQVRIINTSATTASLILGDNNQTATFAGAISDGTGQVIITKIGSGTQTFTGLNTYTGGTHVDAGTLAVGANFTMTGANQVTLAATGVAGTNYATMTSTAGTLTFAGTLGIKITASLVGGESFSLFSASGGALAGDFTNVSLTGSYLTSLTETGSGIWTGTTSGLDFTFATSGVNAGILSVAISAVPEPASCAAIFGALVLGASAFRRRRVKQNA